jgi:hypothetical protein
MAIVLAIALPLGCAASSAPTRTPSKKLTAAAQSVLITVGKNPNDYEAFALKVSKADRLSLPIGNRDGRTSVIFEPRTGRECYPLWVSSLSLRVVEWWLDGRPLTDWQSGAVAAANRLWPTMDGVGSATDFKVFSVVETRDCLCFIRKGSAEKQADGGVTIFEDARVAIDKKTLRESAHCEKQVQQW